MDDARFAHSHVDQGAQNVERWSLLELGFPFKARACEIFLTQIIVEDIKYD